MERGELRAGGGLKRTKDGPRVAVRVEILFVLLSIPSLHQLKLTIPCQLLARAAALLF